MDRGIDVKEIRGREMPPEDAPVSHALPGRFAIFSFLWACAALFHLGKWNDWLHSPLSILVAASAVFLILRPSSLPRFTLFISIQIAESLVHMPFISNHWLFTTFINLTILLALGILKWQGRKNAVSGSLLIRTFEPAVRIELIIFYLFAFFHKLNEDWLDPAVSCGAKLYLLITDSIGFSQGMLPATVIGIYGTLAVEIAIPVMLVLRKTRIAGIALALIYHFILGAGEYYNFSAMMFAGLFLFTPDSFSGRLSGWWSGCRLRAHVLNLSTGGVAQKFWTLSLATFALAAIALFIYTRATETPPWHGIEIREPGSYDKTRLYYLFLTLWILYSTALMYVFLRCAVFRNGIYNREESFFVPRHKLLLLMPALVILNGACPYLGLKTQTSWSMYSNLRTEGHMSNHLIIGEPAYLTDYQTDLVVITGSTDPALDSFAGSGYLIPYFELRSYVSRKTGGGTKPFGLEYIRKGKTTSVSRKEDDPQLFEPDNPALRKLLYFRPVWAGGRNLCRQ